MSEAEKTELLKMVAGSAPEEMLAVYVSPEFGGVDPDRYHYVEAVIFQCADVLFDGDLGSRPVELRLSNDIEDAPAIIVMLDAIQKECAPAWVRVAYYPDIEQTPYHVVAYAEEPGAVWDHEAWGATRAEAIARAFVAVFSAQRNESPHP